MPTDLTRGQIDAYLERLEQRERPAPTHDALAQLHFDHLLRVPFENLDIHLGVPIRLDLPALHEKIVARRRGGHCYELNGLFSALLRGLGYEVQLLSARVARPDGTFSPDFDHLALRVTSPWLPSPQLADVGFGEAFLRPLPIAPGFTRREGAKTLHLEQHGERWIYQEDRGEGMRPQYAFTLEPHELDEFAPRNLWQQTSPESHFTRNRICSLATRSGRVTLTGRRLVVTSGGVRSETVLEPSQVTAALHDRFGIVLLEG